MTVSVTGPSLFFGAIGDLVRNPGRNLDAEQAALALWLLGAALGLMIYCFICIIFRAAMGLPSLAVKDGEGLGMWASWRATKPLARAILGAAAFATLGQGIVIVLPLLLVFSTGPWIDLTIPFTFAREYAASAGLALIDSINALIAAAILARIYKALPATV